MAKPDLTEWQRDGRERDWFRTRQGTVVACNHTDEDKLRMEWALRSVCVRPVFGMRFEIELGQRLETLRGPAAGVYINLSVPERNTGAPTWLSFPIIVLYHVFDSPSDLATVIREALVEWVIPHEVDEMIEVDGVRMFDPHAPGGMDFR